MSSSSSSSSSSSLILKKPPFKLLPMHDPKNFKTKDLEEQRRVLRARILQHEQLVAREKEEEKKKANEAFGAQT